MKKIISILTITSLIVTLCFTIVVPSQAATSNQLTTNGLYRYSGLMSNILLCCAGMYFEISSSDARDDSISGSFLFPWQNMIPLYELGIGLYMYWTIAPNTDATGAAQKTSAECKVYIYGECIKVETADYTVNTMGTIKDSDFKGSGFGGPSI